MSRPVVSCINTASYNLATRWFCYGQLDNPSRREHYDE